MAKKMAKKSKACTVCVGVSSPIAFLVGVAFIAAGVAIYLKFPSILASQVAKRVTVEKGHATYEQLENPTLNIYKKFYFFNFTNYEEFADSKGAATPILDEKGPYSFIEYRTKTFIETSDKDTLNYTQNKIFFYDQDTSNENVSDSDILCTINIPLIAAINMTKDTSFGRVVLKSLINVTDAKIYVCQQAVDLAWEYTDDFIKAIHELDMYPLDYVSIQINDSVYDLNISTINTGVSNISEVGQFIQWNGLTELNIWEEDTGANDIRGTEGFFFRPNLKESDNLTSFVDDVQRSFDLLYEGKVNHLGLSAYRYGIDNSSFKSAFSEPKNARWFSWCPDGMFYLGPTQVKEIPVYGSKPHFLDGDPLLLESVQGLNPVREEHDTVIDIEPITGANVFFQRQLQVNVQVNKTETYEDFDTIHELEDLKGYNDSNVLYLPVLYVNEHAGIDQDFKDYLEDKGLREVRMLGVIVPTICGLLIFFGVVLILVGVLTCFWWLFRVKRGYHADEQAPLLDKK